MTWEWQIGDPVDDATGGSMDAMNWGHGGGDDEDNYSGSHTGYGGYGGHRPSISPEEMNRRILSSRKSSYEGNLKRAREQTNDEKRIEYYLKALEYGRQYFEESKKRGISIEGMPDEMHLLSKEDVDWISQKHYDEYFKLHILSTDQTENLEKLLKESGNGHRIKSNVETRRRRSEENERRRNIDHAKYLYEDYFRCIEKANEHFLKNKPRHAVDKYEEAIIDYKRFFESPYAKNEMKQKMPEKSLTPDNVDNILTIYKNTHPLLKSDAVSEKTNSQIIDMLKGEWDERLREADREVARIVEEKKLERQKRKQKAEDIAVDVIVGARIVGDSILRRFRK